LFTTTTVLQDSRMNDDQSEWTGQKHYVGVGTPRGWHRFMMLQVETTVSRPEHCSGISDYSRSTIAAQIRNGRQTMLMELRTELHVRVVSRYTMHAKMGMSNLLEARLCDVNAGLTTSRR
jgi:hypothetical protein